MEFTLKVAHPASTKTACVVVPVTGGRCLTPAAQALDQASEGQLTQILKRGDLAAEAGKTLLLSGLQGVTASRVLLVETGSDPLKDSTYRTLVCSMEQALANTAVKEVLCTLTELDMAGRDSVWVLEQTVLTLREQRYRIPKQTQTPKPSSHWQKTVLLLPSSLSLKKAQGFVEHAQAVANGTDLTRDLGNLPPNLCTPTHLAETAQAVGKDWGL
ncbi:MAG: leucyl aminopeptidase, partial [Ferrovum sp.]|nr:leucyl aminopeptidase [Ferrovum sp.]